MIVRTHYLKKINEQFKVHSVCALLGQRHMDAPRTTRSMHITIADLKLDHLFAAYPGNVTYPLAEKITAQGLESIAQFGKQVQK